MENRKLTCTNYLFSAKFRGLGKLLILVGVALFFIVPLGISVSFIGWYVIGIGLAVFAFSKEKEEDEMIESIRLRSFMVALIGTVAFIMTYDLIRYLDDGTIHTSAIQGFCLQLFLYILWFRFEMGRNK